MLGGSHVSPNVSTKICFVMAPLGSPESDTRRRSDQVLRHLIGPVARDLGYHAVRADQIHSAGHINAQVLTMISEAPLAIADLTGLNPNVMYELAIRHACGGSVCQIASSDTQLPFDIAGLRTVFFDLANPDQLAAAKDELAAQVHSIIRRDDQYWPLLAGHELIPVRLTDEQTRNLVHLHQASSAFRIYRVIDETVTALEEQPDAFDPEAFFLDIRNALMESRRLCAAFESRRLGNVFRFYEVNYPMEELRAAVEGGLTILLNKVLDANTKRKRLLAYVQNAQLGLDERIERKLSSQPRADGQDSKGT